MASRSDTALRLRPGIGSSQSGGWFLARARSRGNNLTIRWTPAHQGVEGNKQADALAKRAVGEEGDLAGPAYLQEASLSHLTRVPTEARSTSTGEWIRSHVKRRHRYRPPPGGRLRRELGKVRKELVCHFYQLLLGHAAMAPYLHRFGKAPNDTCCWCGTGEIQIRHHLLIRCRRWSPEIRMMWQRVEKDWEWASPRAPSARLLFRDARATPVVLEFLSSTRVGKMPGLPLLGVQEEGSDLEVVELVSREEDGSTVITRRKGLARPRMYFPFVSFFCLIRVSSGDEG